MHQKFWPTIFCVLVLAPNLWALVSPYENWPYTSAPMFSHYVSPETPRYTLTFLGRYVDGHTERLGFYSVGAHWSLMRFFFKYVYGSADSESIFAVYGNDDPSAFNARLARFFAAFYREYRLRHPAAAANLRTIDLWAENLSATDNSITDKHLVGTFDPHTGQFEHLWEKKEHAADHKEA